MKNSQPSLLATLRELPRPVWVLFAGTFLNKFGAFVIPFLSLYLTQRGYSLADAGLAIGAYGLGNLAASILGGYLTDHIGRRKTIVLSMFSAAAAMMLLSMAHSFPLIVVFTALAGLTGELYRPASSALLADLLPPDQRVTAYSAYRMAFNAGWAFGPATAALLATRGYFWLFVGDAATSALFGVIALIALPKGVRAAKSQSGWGVAIRDIAQNRQFHRIILASLCIAMVFFQMASTMGLHVTHLGYSAQDYGLLLSLNGAMVVCFELSLTTITRRYPARRVMALGYALGGIGFAVMGLAHSLLALAGGMAIFTLGEMASMPVASAYIADLAPASMRGRYMGVNTLVWSVGMMFGPALGMQLLAISPIALALGCGGAGLLASIIVLRGKEHPKPEPAYCGASV
jgi:MFS family permease